MLSNVQRSNMMVAIGNSILLDDTTKEIPGDDNRYYCIQTLDDTVFESITNSMCVNKPEGLEGVTLPAGTVITGNFTGLKLTSGMAICYIRTMYRHPQTQKKEVTETTTTTE